MVLNDKPVVLWSIYAFMVPYLHLFPRISKTIRQDGDQDGVQYNVAVTEGPSDAEFSGGLEGPGARGLA